MHKHAEYVPVILNFTIASLYRSHRGKAQPVNVCCYRVAGIVHLTRGSLATTGAYTKWIKSLPGQQVMLRPVDLGFDALMACSFDSPVITSEF